MTLVAIVTAWLLLPPRLLLFRLLPIPLMPPRPPAPSPPGFGLAAQYVFKTGENNGGSSYKNSQHARHKKEFIVSTIAKKKQTQKL